MNDPFLILKIGGSVLCDKSKLFSINQNILDRIVKEIVENKHLKLIIVHGGGSFGHPLAKKYNLTKGVTEENKIGITETHNAMLELNQIITQKFINANYPIIPLSPMDLFITENGVITKSFITPIIKSMEIGLTPLLFGDTVFDIKKGVAILSGDQIISYLGIKLKPKKIILGIDVDGLFLSDPKVNPNAEMIDQVTPKNVNEVLKGLRIKNSSKSIDVTGGMAGKIKEILKVAKKGIEVIIVNITIKNNLWKILNDQPVKCTIFKGWL
ncbi:MAG: isopentenyl phosphate kinase [Candidatus Odinarchaeia archaeon]